MAIQPKHVLTRSADELRTDARAGIARTGGLFRPPLYANAYVQAARWSLDRAIQEGILDEMAMPVAYLQRHALEVMLKDLLSLTHDILDSRRASVTGAVSWTEVPHHHRLTDLADRLAERLREVGYADPSDLRQFAAELGAFEDTDETRTRYSRGKPNGPYRYASFPAETVMPLSDWQERLERLYEVHLHVRESRGEDWSAETLAEELSDEANALLQVLCEQGLL